jgi:hypothetical protein
MRGRRFTVFITDDQPAAVREAIAEIAALR